MKLVGGSGPHEGNIFVGGLPVCDDHHDAQNALVVCRFAKNRGMREIFANLFGSKIIIKTCLGCWGTLMGNTLRILSSDKSLAPSGWTTCSAQATKRPSLTALISLWMIVAHMREQASSAQILVRYKHLLEQEAELCFKGNDMFLTDDSFAKIAMKNNLIY